MHLTVKMSNISRIQANQHCVAAAVKENAAEACSTACKEDQTASLALAAGQVGLLPCINRFHRDEHADTPFFVHCRQSLPASDSSKSPHLQGGDKDAESARLKEAFDTCYSKCVAQETKDVAEERQKVCGLALLCHNKGLPGPERLMCNS